MSSHHFVKEDQEPALLIIDPFAISFEKIQELLEWSPTVIVYEDALPTVLGWGIKVDFVICLFSQIEMLEKELVSQTPIQFIPVHLHDEILTAALRFLGTTNYKTVNILVKDNDSLSVIEKNIDVYSEVYFENKKWSMIRSGHFQKWVVSQTHVFVHPKKNYSLKNLSIDLESLIDGQISIESDSAFWVGEELN